MHKNKNKNHILIDADKDCDKIPFPILIKVLKKLVIEGPFINTIVIYKTHIANIIMMSQI